MSLIIRRVKKICKRKRKSQSNTRKMDSIESSTLIIEEDDVDEEGFPSLNAIHNKPIVGTPILFRKIGGVENDGIESCRVNFVNIVFMREYRNKSCDELRWEDYTCSRKGNSHIKEKFWPYRICKNPVTVSHTFEFIDPPPKNYLKHLDLLSIVKDDKANYSDQKKILFTNKEKINRYKTIKDRSVFTSASIPYTMTRESSNEDIRIAAKHRVTNCSSEIMLEYKKMKEDNMRDFFIKSDVIATTPYAYEQLVQKCNYLLPCENVGLAYKNARPNKLSSKRKKCIFGNWRTTTTNMFDIKKYTHDNKINPNYLWSKLSPYPNSTDHLTINLKCHQPTVLKFKNYLLGRDFLSINS